jgi:hypothetical protein
VVYLVIPPEMLPKVSLTFWRNSSPGRTKKNADD